ADTGFRTHGRLTRFDAREAERAFLGFAAFPVVINFLVRTRRYAHAPAAALVLIDQHNAVFFAFVNRAGRAGCHARRIQAVLAQTRQIHHESVFELAVNIGLHIIEILVAATFFEFGAENFFPVRTVIDFLHTRAGNQRTRPRGRLVFFVAGGV